MDSGPRRGKSHTNRRRDLDSHHCAPGRSRTRYCARFVPFPVADRAALQASEVASALGYVAFSQRPNREKLDAVAKKLLEAETITREEFEAIFPPPFPKKSGTPQPALVPVPVGSLGK